MVYLFYSDQAGSAIILLEESGGPFCSKSRSSWSGRLQPSLLITRVLKFLVGNCKYYKIKFTKQRFGRLLKSLDDNPLVMLDSLLVICPGVETSGIWKRPDNENFKHIQHRQGFRNLRCFNP